MSKVNVKLMGGLGNYLFQIASTYCYGLHHNKELVFTSDDSIMVHKNVLTYCDNILSKIHIQPNTNISYTTYQEPHYHHVDTPQIDGDVRLSGYFQSEKYFIGYSDKVRDLFEFPKDLIDVVKNRYTDMLSKETCSIHVRRGDYLTNPDVHPTQSVDYYREAITHMSKGITLVIFSDDIPWCVEHLGDLSENIVFIDGNPDYIDLLLMSLCDNNIICNSSFSWWGAWLNRNKNKVVISPKNWFGPSLSDHNTCDIHCEGWLVL
tara:strand:- start:1076 stop:1864 length:789 start_codon:yes stop_codon:yes gene_type:complete